jgi:ABC-type lipoprotein release transport system permease subunit
MSVIDNGRRRALIVSGVFEGEAGEADGLLAFIPNRKGKRARYVRSGTLDGVEVRLTFAGEDGAFVTFRYEETGAAA